VQVHHVVRKRAACLAAVTLFWAAKVAAQPWMDTSLPPAARAERLVSAMTLAQELAMVHGTSGSYVGDVAAVTAEAIPALDLEDGPTGVADRTTQVTAFPAPITIAASWDPTLAQALAEASGAEQAAKGTNIVLGPMMNMDRVPLAGRNFEGFGEDPVLAAAMASAVVLGIQSQGLVATAKHYVGNEQETNRMTISSIVDDRTLREIYVPPFAASVQAGAGAVMCSYNQVNGTFACENSATLTHLLKEELGFKGFVMSDWGATHSTVASANGGLDMEMPDSEYFGAPLVSAVAAGTVPASRVRDMTLRILTSMFAAGLFDRPPTGSINADVQSQAHTDLARSAAAQGTVLLSNDGSPLPLDTTKVHSIAVIGSAADTSPVFQGLGSSMVTVTPGSVRTPRQGIAARAGHGITVGFAGGTSSPFDDATSLARQSDVAVVVVGVTSSEGSDRTTLSLPDPDDALISAVAHANPKTIVVAYAPAQILMPWAHQVAAILFSGLPGQEEGDAIADVLFGDVNPSGKLPMTIANAAADYPANTALQFPGVGDVVTYSEGFLVGYRSFDARRIAPLFPFGHGLSYTTFGYANLAVSPSKTSPSGKVEVSLDVRNRGQRAGAEVVQFYLGLPAETSEPPLQLKGFQKVLLAPGASQHVTFTLDPTATAFWSAGRQSATVYPGTYSVAVGSSSRDLRLQGSFEVRGGPLSGTVLQAEAAKVCCSATVMSDETGYTGTGFVSGYTAAGAATIFDVAVPTSGSCAVTARYSAALSNQTPQPAHTLSLYVNGQKIRDVAFAPLANLDTWDFETETVELRGGSNTIAYVQDTVDTGGVDLDALIDCVPVDAPVTRDGGTRDAAVADTGSAMACPVACAPPDTRVPVDTDTGCGCRATGRTRDSRGTPVLLAMLPLVVALRRLRRRLNLAMIRRLHARLSIPIACLVQDYKLKGATSGIRSRTADNLPALRTSRPRCASLALRNGTHPVVHRIVLDLGEADRFEHRGDIHAEAAAEPFLQTVPALDWIRARAGGNTTDSYHGRCRRESRHVQSPVVGRSRILITAPSSI
jgi:beta-glucosidase